jgi:hypothetical protein
MTRWIRPDLQGIPDPLEPSGSPALALDCSEAGMRDAGGGLAAVFPQTT